MVVESKTFHADPEVALPLADVRVRSSASPEPRWRVYFTWAQIIIAFLFLEFSLWEPKMHTRNRWIAASAAAILLFTLIDRPSLERLGLRLPKTFGASMVLGISFAGILVMALSVYWAGGAIPASPTWPTVHVAWQYLIWALLQEFMLQSFFFTRCERLFGGQKAVWVAASLFAMAHLPSPVLTTFTLLGALFFCEMFRRYRSIYPLGVVHAMLGLTIAATMPDSVLHHMRVGIAYFHY
jgi:hypothetical protein